jgi:kynurenine formamidase
VGVSTAHRLIGLETSSVDIARPRLVDLSHTIEAGMVTYKGLPGPLICDYWSREASAAHYDDGSSFQIGRIDMVANTGTYLDCPFHRYEEGADLAGVPLEALTALPGIVIRKPHGEGLAIDAADIEGAEVGGKAVLLHTGWDAHWRTDAYFETIPSSLTPRPGCSSSAAPGWSASTATISTTRGRGRVRCIRSSSAPGC